MKAEELRLGNYVLYNGMGLEVFSIQNKLPRLPEGGRYDNAVLIDLVCDGFITSTLEELSPIPLTEDILTKCGFENIRGYSFYSYKRDNHSKECPLDVHIDSGRADIRGCAINSRIASLHQLQNLFYMIYGKEMIISKEIREDKKDVIFVKAED